MKSLPAARLSDGQGRQVEFGEWNFKIPGLKVSKFEVSRFLGSEFNRKGKSV